MGLTAAYLTFANHGEKISPRKPFSTFPKQIGQWKGKESFFDKQIYDVLGVDDSVLVRYENQEGDPVELYVGFYESQREGDIIHSPRNCMPGAGWSIINSSIEKLSLNGKQQKHIEVIKLTISKNSQQQVVLYWFQSRGRYISSEYFQKFYLIWDSILKNRTDGSFVRLISPVSHNDMDYTTAYLKKFAVEIIPILNEYIPGAEE
ncbi:MAG: EpsI family protein [Desulfobacteraceae bacterium]|nr:MAG: EpsI family protein [Desulfobacteraceae bacterium]